MDNQKNLVNIWQNNKIDYLEKFTTYYNTIFNANIKNYFHQN